MTATFAVLPGDRVHLQDGPIDCVCRADGDAAEVAAAYARAASMFPGVLPALCGQRAFLRSPLPAGERVGFADVGGDMSGVRHPLTLRAPSGEAAEAVTCNGIARAMHAAVAPYADRGITPMAAVAGAVADHLLAAMTAGGRLRRAFVNNGGDIAAYLAPGETLRVALVTDLAAAAHDATVTLARSGGAATSGRACKGRGGRSFSFGIADAVTVLARDAARADAAATVIGNAVDLPGHPAVARRPAADIDPDSDLGVRLITWDVGALTDAEIATALDAGRALADVLVRAGLIDAAVLALRGRMVTAGAPFLLDGA